MNDKPETAARPDAGSAAKPSEKSEDGSSPSTLTGSAAAEPSHAGPSLFDRVLGLCRPRNPTRLRV
jgi:hypothetical protein